MADWLGSDKAARNPAQRHRSKRAVRPEFQSRPQPL